MQVKAKLVSLSLLFLIGFPFLVEAQTSLERHQRIRSAVDVRDFATAIQELRSMQTSDAKTFSANNYDYLLARLSEQSGDRASAQSNYDTVIARNSILAGYSFWHLAQMARATGDLVLERERLRRFIATAPNTQLQEAATLRLGESFSESGDNSGTIASLRPLINSSNVPTAREAMTLTGQALKGSGNVSEARAVFTKLVMQMPDAARPDDFALVAVRALDEMDAASGSPAQLSEADHLLRASVYHFNRDFAGARKHYLAVVQNNPKNPTVPNALFQLGRGFYLQGQYSEALNYFQRVEQEFPESSSARDALSFSAGAYNRLKQTDAALAAYQKFLQRYPDAPNPERTYLNLIDALHEASRYKEALSWVQQTRTKFQGQLGATLALFGQLRINLAQGNWEGVVADAEELRKARDLGGTRVASGTTSSEVSFLHGFALEQLGRTSEAVDVYLSIPDGRNEYYGQRATARLQAMVSDAKTQNLIQSRERAELATAKQSDTQKARAAATATIRLSTSDSTRNEALQVLKTTYQSLPGYSFPAVKLVPLGRQTFVSESSATQTLSDELFFLGLYDEAVPLYVAAQPTPPPGEQLNAASDLNYTLATLSLRGGLANRAVRYGEALWRPIAADFVIQLAPREFTELLYPAPYREALTRHAPSRDIDPRLVLAIARQESRFMVAAKSVAAARGMMQFIPETANEMARQLGKNGFQQDELYDPDTAILFGSEYLSTLFKQFPGQAEAVIASYNGGPDNVARWVARSRSNVPERYVPEIGFAQTKDYVFRVMTNLRAYQQLYPQL